MSADVLDLNGVHLYVLTGRFHQLPLRFQRVYWPGFIEVFHYALIVKVHV